MEKKTPDQTLEYALLKSGVSKFSCNIASCKGVLINAMETYANQETAALKKENEELMRECVEFKFKNAKLVIKNEELKALVEEYQSMSQHP